MKKILKIIVFTIISLISIYTLFFIEESIRLSHNIKAKPLIVLKEESEYNSIKYESLGFSLTNKYGKPQVEDSNKIVCIGQEIWLFNYFLIWGWIS